MLKSIICSLLITTTLAYMNMTLDQMAQVQKQSRNGRIVNVEFLDPISYFKELLNLPPTLIGDLLTIGNLKPPIKYPYSKKVRTPPASEVKRHWYHGTRSYCPISYFTNYKCFSNCPDFKVTQTFENLLIGSFAIAGIDSTYKEIVISHRGTFNIRGWLRDFSYGKINLPNAPPGVKVHEGFWGVYKSNADNINNYLMSLLDNPKYKGYKVVFTGHSLGAATCTAHAVDMAPKLKAKGFEIELYPYHGPRVGNPEFVNYAVNLNITIGRYTHKGDIVSHFYPRQWEYAHLPGEFHTDLSDLLGNSFRECSQEYDEDPNCGWKEYNWTFLDHLFGFGNPINIIC